MPAEPVPLGPNHPPRFYRARLGIALLRGTPLPSDYCPEDWVGSTVPLSGQPAALSQPEPPDQPGDGLTRLASGQTLRAAIAADPAGYLGAARAARLGADPGLLVKLLDTGERLIVHFHPGREFAWRHLGSRYGKTEAWIILATRPAPGDASAGHVYLGFRDDADPALVRRWVAGQDTAALLGSLNEVPVAPGDTWLVPAGVPHAIGAGVTLVEAQEPTDLSVMLEWAGFPVDGAAAGHLGLGFDVALTALDYRGWGAQRLRALARREPGDPPGPASQPGVTRLLPAAADEFFRAERVDVAAPVDFGPGYAILVVADGEGRVRYPAGSLAVRRGTTLLVPYGAGPTTLEGEFTAVRCRPARLA